MRRGVERGNRLWLCFAVSLLAAGVAHAQSEPIEFEIQVVHGSNVEGQGRVDPACAESGTGRAVQATSSATVIAKTVEAKGPTPRFPGEMAFRDRKNRADPQNPACPRT